MSNKLYTISIVSFTYNVKLILHFGEIKFCLKQFSISSHTVLKPQMKGIKDSDILIEEGTENLLEERSLDSLLKQVKKKSEQFVKKISQDATFCY